MPVNKLYPIEKLLEILKKYTRKAKRKIFYEYVMLK
jgi:adenine C2-methylase RlmN of 23S rRNA A2503 and tRNA A37